MKPPIAVALITHESGDIFVGQRCDKGDDLQELELLGGRIKDIERPDLTVEERVWSETGSYVRTLGLFATLHFEDDGEVREAQVWRAELLSGPELYAREPEVHGSIRRCSLDELQAEGVHLSSVLSRVLDMFPRP